MPYKVIFVSFVIFLIFSFDSSDNEYNFSFVKSISEIFVSEEPKETLGTSP